MVHWKTRGLFRVHRGELRTATAQWLREENTVFTVLWKSLRHGRPQRSSEPTHYSRSHQTLSKNYPLRCWFHCLLVSSEVQKKYGVHYPLEEPQTGIASEVIGAYTIESESPNIVQKMSVTKLCSITILVHRRASWSTDVSECQ